MQRIRKNWQDKDKPKKIMDIWIDSSQYSTKSKRSVKVSRFLNCYEITSKVSTCEKMGKI